MGTARYAKWEYASQRASGYARRKPSKDLAEKRLVSRILRGIRPVHTVLDVPCGAGRFSEWFHEQDISRVAAADTSMDMLQICRANGADAIDCIQADLEQLGLADRAFELVFCFRLFHHLPTHALREQVVTELCRVSARYVALSYNHWLSPTSFGRWYRSRFRHQPLRRFSHSSGYVAGLFRAQGFERVVDRARCPLIHTLHLALFKRVDAGLSRPHR